MDRKRKIDHDSGATAVGLSLCEMLDSRFRERGGEGWDALQPLLEREVLHVKIPSTDAALSHLVRWFRIIANDNEKLRVFRQWVIPSPDVKLELNDRTDCISKTVSSTVSSSTSTSSSITTLLSDVLSKSNNVRDSVVNDVECSRSTNNCSTGSFIPDSNLLVHFLKNPINNTAQTNEHHQVLLQQLLQQHQQQIVLLQQLQKQAPSSPQNDHSTASKTTISIFPRMGCTGTLLIVSLKDGRWHTHTPLCECTLGFTVANDTVSARRIPGGSSGDLFFIVPQLNGANVAAIAAVPVTIQLTLCGCKDAPLVCLDPFLYTPGERALTSSASDEDSEEMAEDAAEEDEGSPPPQALPPLDIPNTACPTPKQMMTIRERMMAHTQNGGSRSARLIVLQQPSVRVVWKNRRLDIPFKLKLDFFEDTQQQITNNNGGSAFSALAPSKIFILAVVADHKGRLQMDAAENVTEDCSTQGLAHFSNLRMTKGTWGKEWTITFAAVVKTSLNNPIVVGVSVSCPIVVKTRKNPQVRHGKQDSPSSSPTVTFVERKPNVVVVDSVVRPKRHKIEDLLDPLSPPFIAMPPLPSPSRPPSRATTNSHSEDMASLLAAAELKQQEQKHHKTVGGGHKAQQQQQQQQAGEEPADVPSLPLMSKGSDDDMNNNNSNSSSSNNNELTFANFQNLMTYLDDIRLKRQISLGIVEQPTPKRDSKVLVVKKGKPFRVPFQIQLRSTAARHNPQHYVCVAVIRNDKGEEVAVRNSEVPFDWRGIACFAGLMVMKGTWGKTVQLTFEARWAARQTVTDNNNNKTTTTTAPCWTTQRMFVVSDTSPLQLMCYTKDKKSPSAM